MRNLWRLAAVLAVFGCGYLLGTQNLLAPRAAQAQPDEYSVQAQERLLAALQTMQAAAGTLETEGKLVPASDGLNAFATSVGGIDVRSDLEKFGRVDPETFAAFYAGYAAPDLIADIKRNAEGQITYKGQVVRMYSVEKLRELFERRKRLANPDN